jgi:hypothetical protein
VPFPRIFGRLFAPDDDQRADLHDPRRLDHMHRGYTGQQCTAFGRGGQYIIHQSAAPPPAITFSNWFSPTRTVALSISLSSLIFMAR